ncbi:cupin domain-containing protein [Marinomonas algarum]|uniref:Cupin domain-containing protein n=1 Tax=Marinomonas algarum TaxID=2883105 RepID=A0A9X1LFC5_9GAMM|nr:cupin domain-containing protein [Marinomonas algarum]MCB5162883.1 cupin domain-containing protein [Marinomonas algarum]
MLNMNFTVPVMIDTTAQEWQPSPMAGVLRKPLAREEKERGHATSVVCYHPGSSFRSHQHPLGEEILVLEGVFSDENGSYPAGSYFRNPPGSAHAPYSDEGCLLLVKLHQFQADDCHQVMIKSPPIWFSEHAESFPLYRFGQEQVWLVRNQEGENTLPLFDNNVPVEIFVISGHATYAGTTLSIGTWMREPSFDRHQWQSSADCLFWLKVGHF